MSDAHAGQKAHVATPQLKGATFVASERMVEGGDGVWPGDEPQAAAAGAKIAGMAGEEIGTQAQPQWDIQRMAPCPATVC